MLNKKSRNKLLKFFSLTKNYMALNENTKLWLTWIFENTNDYNYTKSMKILIQKNVIKNKFVVASICFNFAVKISFWKLWGDFSSNFIFFILKK